MTEEQVIAAMVKAIEKAQPQSQWYQQANLVSAAIVVAVGYIAWSLKMFFGKFMASIEDLYDKHHGTQQQLDHLQGEHDMVHGTTLMQGHPCRRREDREHV